MEKEQLKARFFGMHIGCPFTHPDFEEPQELWGAAKWQLAKHHGFSASCFYKDGWVDIERCQLILKPLSSISNEEAIEVAKLNPRFGPIGEHEVYLNGFDNKVVKKKDGPAFEGVCITEEKMNAGQCDYLRSIGVCLPYLSLDAVKEGWAIIEENK